MPAGKYAEWLEPDGLLRLEAWARDGLTLEQIAHNCGCSLTSIKDWRNKYPAISTALKKGRDVADIAVENALYKRAMGYACTETTIEESDKDGRKIRTTTKQVIPDVAAQIFWLKNRRPDRWRDKQPVDDQGGDTCIKVIFGDSEKSEKEDDLGG